MKAKGKQNRIEAELLALVFTLAGWQRGRIAADCKSVNGNPTTVQGFESLTRRRISSPVKAGTSARELKRTGEAVRIREFSIRLLAVELNRRFHSDLPQFPDRRTKTWVSTTPLW
jgi:hypothetical protein